MNPVCLVCRECVGVKLDVSKVHAGFCHLRLEQGSVVLPTHDERHTRRTAHTHDSPQGDKNKGTSKGLQNIVMQLKKACNHRTSAARWTRPPSKTWSRPRGRCS